MKSGAVSGVVKPALPGAKVQLQRQRGTTWATVATAAPDGSGSFAVGAPLAPARTACAGPRRRLRARRLAAAGGVRETRAARGRRARGALRAGRLARRALGRRRAARAAEAQVAAQLPGARTLVPGRALVVDAARRPQVRGARYVMRLDGVKRRVASARKTAFANTEPYRRSSGTSSRTTPGTSGREEPQCPRSRSRSSTRASTTGHPSSRAGWSAGRSFVGDSWQQDTEGHGTFVAGDRRCRRVQRHRDRRARLQRELLIGEGRRARRLRLARRRGRGDHVGGRPRRAR